MYTFNDGHPAQSPDVPQTVRRIYLWQPNLMKAENFSIVPMSGEIAKMLTEELDGLGQVPFDTVKIPSGGGLAFEVPGDDPDNPETAQSLTGVIVHHHPVNVYWEHDFDGSGGPARLQQPRRQARPGHKDRRDRDCATCPFNQFGSGGKGSAKACKKHPSGLPAAGERGPAHPADPAAHPACGAFKDYLAKRLIMKGKRSSDVITCIKLKKEKNADGIAYSACVFSKSGRPGPRPDRGHPAHLRLDQGRHQPCAGGGPERRAGCKRRLCGCARRTRAVLIIWEARMDEGKKSVILYTEWAQR